ncbi:GNAT family N-acetyltransferase [Roseovarius sp. 217]|uniref:GNAT family N-acetyltransferase n=1 Tax=Roseovarius sp. (strain 217) TaxID=314264 RepID=UPI00006859AB|nr:GNAT family N-acetyltransferase [Roseovarius sp. 217]EAQ27016.1 possible FemAB family protein [Roseovarius sp. 217]
MDILLTDFSAPPASAPLHQQPQYARALRALGVTVQTLRAVQDGHTLAQAQVVERRIGPLTFHWMPRGPIWRSNLPPASCHAILSALSLALPRGLWLTNAATEADGDQLAAQGYRALIPGQTLAELDLRPPRAMRLAAQHGKWRNRLRHAQAAGLVIIETSFDPNRHSALLRQEAVQQRTCRYRALPLAFTLAYAAQNPGTVQVWSAHHKAESIAHLLILTHGDTATYHIGWTGSEGRRLSAHTLLLWEAATALADRGIVRLDLGPADSVQSPGLTRFKLGSGALAQRLGPSMLTWPRAVPLFPKRHKHAA